MRNNENLTKGARLTGQGLSTGEESPLSADALEQLAQELADDESFQTLSADEEE